MPSQLPAYVTIMLAGHGEDFDPEVISTPMERGLPKMRLGNSRVTVKVSATLRFRTRADTVAFDTWYFNDIGRIGWFDVFDARYNTTRSMRFEGGKLGKLVPDVGRYGKSTRSVTLEYLR